MISNKTDKQNKIKPLSMDQLKLLIKILKDFDFIDSEDMIKLLETLRTFKLIKRSV